MGLEAGSLFGIVLMQSWKDSIPGPLETELVVSTLWVFMVCAILVYGFGPLSQSKNRQLFTELE